MTDLNRALQEASAQTHVYRSLRLDGWTWFAHDRVRHVLGTHGVVLGCSYRLGLLVEWDDGATTWTEPANVRGIKHARSSAGLKEGA